MAIRTRLILALGLLLLTMVLATVIALLFDARHRVQSEVASGMRSTEMLLRSSLDSLKGAPYHAERLAIIVNSLQRLRHVKVRLEGQTLPAPTQQPSRTASIAELFSVDPGPAIRVPVTDGNEQVATLLLEPQLTDEMSEVIETIGRVAGYAAIFAAAAMMITSLLIARALAPIHALDEAMHAMEDGNDGIQVPDHGAPEISRICTQFNNLSAAIRKSRQENQRLATAMVKLQDQERQDIARDLHDEFGPHLFLMRATAHNLQRTLGSAQANDANLVRMTNELLEAVDAIQMTNRRVLNQLNPIGLDELGLESALRALVALWSKQNKGPEIKLALNLANCAGLDKTVALTIYRMVQEALTNAMRHAGAKTISISVEKLAVAGHGTPHNAIAICVQDDGKGFNEDSEENFGLTGMRGRINALGGTLDVVTSPDNGTRISANLPIVQAVPV